MRKLTDSERQAMQVPLREFWIKRDGLLPKETRAFEAGFVTALDHQQAKINTLLAFVNGKITRRELEEVIGQ